MRSIIVLMFFLLSFSSFSNVCPEGQTRTLRDGTEVFLELIEETSIEKSLNDYCIEQAVRIAESIPSTTYPSSFYNNMFFDRELDSCLEKMLMRGPNYSEFVNADEVVVLRFTEVGGSAQEYTIVEDTYQTYYVVMQAPQENMSVRCSYRGNKSSESYTYNIKLRGLELPENQHIDVQLSLHEFANSQKLASPYRVDIYANAVTEIEDGKHEIKFARNMIDRSVSVMHVLNMQKVDDL